MILTEGSNLIDGPNGVVHARVWPVAPAFSGSPIVAVHGVDGNHAAWAGLAEALDGRRPLVAVDLRGRGDSSIEGSFGVAAHAEDLAAVVDAVLTESDHTEVTLVGHSFGGHVVARLAADRPGAIEQLVLVDGGPPRLVPEVMTPEELVAGALGNILPNLEAKPYPISAQAVEADFASMVIDPVGARALFEVDVPVHLLRAELGVAPGLPPVVPDAVVAELIAAGLEVQDEVIAGVTHFSILGAPEVLAALG